MLVYRLAHYPDVSSPPRSISSDGARPFRSESDSTASSALFLQESSGTWELKIREGSHSTSLRFSNPSRFAHFIMRNGRLIHNSRRSPYVSGVRRHFKFELIAYG